MLLISIYYLRKIIIHIINILFIIVKDHCSVIGQCLTVHMVDVGSVHPSNRNENQ